MYELKLKCKVITPLFMAGADGRTPELRPSEIKGVMRWWWRAIKAEDNMEKLRREEAEIFGGTGEGMGKSKIQIKINTELESSDIYNYQPLPHHKNGKRKCDVCNTNYCKKAFSLKAIKPGKEIYIIFCFLKSLINEIESLIYLTFILGGFGKRSRRGFGSIKIISPSFPIELESILNALNKINNSYEIDFSSFISGLQVIKNKKTSGGNYPWVKEIILSERKFNSVSDILNAIGLASHKHKDPSLGYASPRMASPIYVSVVEIGENLHPIITILNNSFPTSYPNCNFDKQKNFIKELV